MNGMAKKESLIGRKIVFEVKTKLVEVSGNTLDGFVQKVQSLLTEKKKIVYIAAIVAISEESSLDPAQSAFAESSQPHSDIHQVTEP